MFAKKGLGAKGVILKVASLVMILSMFFGGPPPQMVFGAEVNQATINRNIKILEIRGGTSSSELKNLSNTTITTMSMKKFVALREELSGKYDVIYIGSGNYSNQGVQGKNHNTTSVMNDITKLKAGQIQEEFIDKGQIVILHQDIFKNEISPATSNLRTAFDKYKTGTFVNVIKVSKGNDVKKELEKDPIKHIINKRPIIKEVKFTYSFTDPENPEKGKQESKNTIDIAYTLEKNLDFKQGNLNAKIYLDANNNKQYETDEILLTTKVTSAEGNISYTLPPSYSGLRFLKFEIINEQSDLKDFKEDKVKLKGSKVKINVLQVTRANNDPSDLNKFLVGKLGGINSNYEIKINVISLDAFKTLKYEDLNGKYDMLIFGFADSYNNADIGTDSAKVVEDFINTGQSVMFTHDTMFGTGNTWVKQFADDTGQIGVFHDLGNGAPQQSTKTKKVNSGLILEYPFKLKDNITIANTHSQYYGLNLEDPTVIPWYNITGGGRDEDDSWNHYYTYSKGTVTYSGTGHTNNYSNVPEETDLFVNTMYTAFFGANHAPTITMLDPVEEVITVEHTDLINLKYIVKDLDLRDEILNTTISFNKEIGSNEWDEKLNINIPRGGTVDRSFANPMPHGGSFDIKIEARDQLGARAERIIKVNVKAPVPSNLKISREFIPEKIDMSVKRSKIEYVINFPTLNSNPNNEIANIILTNQIPKGLKVNQNTLPTGWTSTGDPENGYTLIGKIAPIQYTESNGEYIANPLTFQVEVEAVDNGVYKLEGGQISFIDLDRNEKILPLEEAILTVETRVTSVKLDKNALVIKKGQEDILNVVVSPENASNKNVKWESSNRDIVTVRWDAKNNQWQANVSGHNIGTATITVTSLDNENAKDNCTVTVINPVEGIRIEPDEAEVRVAQTLALKVIFEPEDAVNQNVTWRSSDTNIATVDENGLVLALKQGQVVITAKAEENGLEANASIKVNPLLEPLDPSKPTIAGYGYIHPLSLANMTMTMKVESQINGAQLIMGLPKNKGLLFDAISGVKVKKDGVPVEGISHSFGIEGRHITIELGNLIGYDKAPNTYTITVYAKITPSDTLSSINDYNSRVEIDKEKLTVSNKLKGTIDLAGSNQEVNFDLDSYHLELIKIPTIN